MRSLLACVQDTTTNPVYTGESGGLSLEDERMQVWGRPPDVFARLFPARLLRPHFHC